MPVNPGPPEARFVPDGIQETTPLAAIANPGKKKAIPTRPVRFRVVTRPGSGYGPAMHYKRVKDEKATYAQKVCVGQAGKLMRSLGMIGAGARVGVAVSGGVDSFVLLNVLRIRRRINPFPFDVMALHVNPGFAPDSHAPLVHWCAARGMALHAEVADHGPRAHSEENRKRSACFYCAMLRRNRLFELCRLYGLTHLAMGHNADDLHVTFFMNIFQTGKVSGLSPDEPFFEGRLRMIRPLLGVQKTHIVRAARQWGLPVWSNPCPSAGHTRRADFSQWLDDLYARDKRFRANVFGALGRWQLDPRDRQP